MTSPLLRNARSSVAAVSNNVAKLGVSEIIQEWPQGVPFDAAEVLAQHPELARHKSAILDLAYEEYCRQVEAGQRIDPTVFTAGFPRVQKSLLALLDVHQFLSENPQLLAGPSRIHWPAVGETFLGFRLKEELGAGAFSRVFLGAETALGDRPVVVKVCWRGVDEARFLGKLSHPHIVSVLSVQSDSATGLTAMCMPYSGRATLLDVLDAVYGADRVPASAKPVWDAVDHVNSGDESLQVTRRPGLFGGSYVNEIVRLGAQLADALTFTHAKGICHGDVKPSNVLITPVGNAMFLDFNLSFDAQEWRGGVGGTIQYMAPEALRAIDKTSTAERIQPDPRADLYSLGVTLYESLTGHFPFGSVPAGLTQSQIPLWLLEQQHRDPCPLRKFNHRVDTELAQLVEGCLAFDPNERPQSAAELAARLKPSLTRRRRVARWRQTHPRISATAGVVSLVASVCFAYALAVREPYSVRQFKAGLEAQARGQPVEAISHYDRAFEADPKFVDALFARGRAHLRSGDMQLAFKDFTETAKVVEDGCVTACRAYCICTLDKQYGTASTWFKQAIDQQFASAAVYNDLGYCYLQTRKLEEAARYLKEAVRLDGDLQPAFHNLAIVEFRLALQDKRSAASVWMEAAIEHIKTAIRLGPPTAELYLDSARTYATACRLQAQGLLDERPAYVERTLASCRQAIELGLDPDRLRNVGTCFPPLRNDPRFRELEATRRAASTSPRSVHLVDPLGDTRTPITLKANGLRPDS